MRALGLKRRRGKRLSASEAKHRMNRPKTTPRLSFLSIQPNLHTYNTIPPHTQPQPTTPITKIDTMKRFGLGLVLLALSCTQAFVLPSTQRRLVTVPIPSAVNTSIRTRSTTPGPAFAQIKGACVRAGVRGLGGVGDAIDQAAVDGSIDRHQHHTITYAHTRHHPHIINYHRQRQRTPTRARWRWAPARPGRPFSRPLSWP